jgi:stage II sporulation protein E
MSAVVGVVGICALWGASTSVGYSSSFLAAAGVASTLFVPLGKFATALLFVAANITGFLTLGTTGEFVTAQLDVLVGSAIFLLMPKKSTGLFVKENAQNESVATLVGSRLDFIFGTLQSMRKNAESISSILEKKEQDIVQCVTDEVCSRCKSSSYCHASAYDRTNGGLGKLQKKRSLTPFAVTQILPYCVKANAIAASITKHKSEKLRRNLTELKMREMQSLLRQQMSLTEEIIFSGCKDISQGLSIDTVLTEQLCAILSKKSIRHENAAVYWNSTGKVSIEIYFRKERYIYIADEIRDILIVEMDMDLDCAEPLETEALVKLVITEKSRYSVSFFIETAASGRDINQNEKIIDITKSEKKAETNEKSVQLSKQANELYNGDTAESFSDGLGNVYLVISDGMGTGAEAAEKSQTVLAYFKKLIRAGIDSALAVKMVNTVMLAKSQSEVFATLDAASINLDTGELRILKSGAASTLIFHDGNLKQVSAQSLPIGILHEQEPAEVGVPEFTNEDLLIMLSDCATEEDYPKFKEILLKYHEETTTAHKSLEILGRELFECVKEKSGDDITVALVKLVDNY